MSVSPVMIITGASSGIGEATALLFAQRGYRVVLAARRANRLHDIADRICAAGGQALPVQTDVTQQSEIETLVRTCIDRYGQIDLLFNNAGFGRFNWLEKLAPEEDIEQQLKVDLLGLILTTRSVLPHMIARRSGHIINMASMASWIATPTYTIYAAGKFGVRGFSDALRREIGVWGIRVSTIYPGGVETEFSQHTGAQRKTGITTPRPWKLSAEQVAEGVWSLARRPRRSLIMPWPMRLATIAQSLAPGLLDKAMEYLFVRPERGR